MVRNIFASIAKETENKLSTFKFSRKVCVVLATIITFTSIGVSTAKIDFKQTEALALGESVDSATAEAPTKRAKTNKTVANNDLDKVTIIKYDRNEQTVYVDGTVRKALSASKTVLKKSDELNHQLSDNTYDGMTITVDKVKYRTKSVTEKISLKKFKKEYPNKSTKKLSDESKIIVNKTVQVKYVNGEETSETIKSFSYKNVKKDTKKYSDIKTISELEPEKDFELDKNGVPVKYSKKITGTASAYCCGTHTATGKSVKPGYIAVNPRQIPYGTKLFIRTPDGSFVYGYASAEDTGGFVSWGNTVADLYMWSYGDCVSFGRRTIEIYVLD